MKQPVNDIFRPNIIKPVYSTADFENKPVKTAAKIVAWYTFNPLYHPIADLGTSRAYGTLGAQWRRADCWTLHLLQHEFKGHSSTSDSDTDPDPDPDPDTECTPVCVSFSVEVYYRTCLMTYLH